MMVLRVILSDPAVRKRPTFVFHAAANLWRNTITCFVRCRGLCICVRRSVRGGGSCDFVVGGWSICRRRVHVAVFLALSFGVIVDLNRGILEIQLS